MNKVKSNKPLRYADGQMQTKLISKYTTKKIKLEVKLAEINKQYVALAQETNEKKLRVRRVLRLSEKIRIVNLKINRLENNIELLNEGKFIIYSPYKRFKIWFKQIPYKKQKSIWGVIFVLPWVIGFSIFFLRPIFSTIWWSFNSVKPVTGGLDINFTGLANYKALFDNYTVEGRIFLEVMTSSTLLLLTNLPIILIFSLFIAVLLNTKFKGHQIVKSIFFIPVIYNAKVIEVTMSGQFGSFFSRSMAGERMLSEQFSNFLFKVGIGEGLVQVLVEAVSRIFTIVNMSGIQILIFIAALQSIPKHLYEAAKVEGATKYESFWKITFPMVSPMFLPAIVYTIVDTFASAPIMRFILISSSSLEYGISSAIAVLFFLVNAIIIVVIFALLRKVVFYYDE